MLRAVLANAPNSIPPERVFSILNDTFDDDQERALADYIELSLQLQYNERRALAQSVVSCEGVNGSGHSALARARLLVGVWLGGNLPIYCQSLESVEPISKINLLAKVVFYYQTTPS